MAREWQWSTGFMSHWRVVYLLWYRRFLIDVHLEVHVVPHEAPSRLGHSVMTTVSLSQVIDVVTMGNESSNFHTLLLVLASDCILVDPIFLLSPLSQSWLYFVIGGNQVIVHNFKVLVRRKQLVARETFDEELELATFSCQSITDVNADPSTDTLSGQSKDN